MKTHKPGCSALLAWDIPSACDCGAAPPVVAPLEAAPSKSVEAFVYSADDELDDIARCVGTPDHPCSPTADAIIARIVADRVAPATDVVRVLTAERGRTFHDGTDWRAEYDRLLSALTTTSASPAVVETTADAAPSREALQRVIGIAAYFSAEDQAAYDALRWLQSHLPALLDAQRDAGRMDFLEDAIVEQCGKRFCIADEATGGIVYIETWGSTELRAIIDAARASFAPEPHQINQQLTQE